MLLALSTGAHPIQTKPLTFATSEPEATLSVTLQFVAETEEDYQKKGRRAGSPKTRPLCRSNASLQLSVLLRVSVSASGLKIIIAVGSVDGDEQQGYVIYVDLNANGDLSDDSPLRCEQQGRGYACLFRATVHDVKKNPPQTYPLALKLVIANLIAPGQTEPRLYLSILATTERRGVIRVGPKDLAFNLQGAWGIYDGEHNEVYFDHDGDGKFDQGIESLEHYFVADKYHQYWRSELRICG